MSAAPAVYRLQSRLAEGARIIVLEEDSHDRLHRVLVRGLPADTLQGLRGNWTGEPDERRLQYPSLHADAPIFTLSSLEVLGPELKPAGRLVPVTVEGAEGPIEGSDEYFVYVVEPVVDCLDAERSSTPHRITKYLKQAVFRPDRLPDLPAFRVPESPAAVYWTAAAAERIVEVVGPDAEALLVWSADPARPVHPNPFRA